jgi:Uri superfamily endonuclease
MRGTYTIIISCKKSVNLRFGGLGRAKTLRGLYVYSGSALGQGAMSLEGRISRHSRSHKKIRWHVDCMTSKQWCTVKAAIHVESPRRLECDVNNMLVEKLNASPPLPHIGASDCKCRGHLMRVTSLREKALLKQIWAIYSKFGNPVYLAITKRPR